MEKHLTYMEQVFLSNNKSQNCIIGIAGSLASGKSIAAKALSEKYSIPVFSFGKLIEEVLFKEGTAPTRNNLQQKGMSIIEQIGYTGIANLLLITYGISQSTACIIEGIRHIDVLNFYEEKFSNNFVSLFIDASKEARFSRIKGIEYKKLIINTLEEFDKTDNHQIEQQIYSIKQKSMFIVENNGDKDKFLSAVLSINYCEK